MSSLNIDAIRSSLIEVQQHFPEINAALPVKQKPPSNEVIENLLQGYRTINTYITNDVDLLALGNSNALLHLNEIVLYYSAGTQQREQHDQFESTKTHFYEMENGGIGDLMEWMDLHEQTHFWKKSAGVFCHMVAQPQLFLEGNHRVATLVVSYLMMKEGYAPFVVTMDNAKDYFDITEQMKQKHNRGFIDELFCLPKLTTRLAKLFEAQQTQTS